MNIPATCAPQNMIESNKLAKLRRCVSRVHFQKFNLGKIQCEKIQFGKIQFKKSLIF